MLALRNCGTVLIGALLTMTNSCHSDRQQTEKAEGSVAQASANQPSPAPSLQPTTIEEHNEITVVHFPNEPFAVLRIDVANTNDLKNSRLTLEVQNVSEKTVRLVTYGLGESVLCSEFMYAMIPTPNMGYGDWRIVGAKTNLRDEPPLKPRQRATITIERDQNLAKLLNPKTFRSCPEGHKKPELMLQNVYFVDGTEWRPNQQRSRSGVNTPQR